MKYIWGLAFVFGVADVGACLLQVIHADKNVFSRAIATKKTRSGLLRCLVWRATGKISWSSRHSFVRKVMQCSGARNSLGNQGLSGTKRPFFLWLAPKRRSQKRFSAGGTREKRTDFDSFDLAVGIMCICRFGVINFACVAACTWQVALVEKCVLPASSYQ